jgi:SpoVK/Ycf46/Vps4 family AAA+-type ATPase
MDVEVALDPASRVSPDAMRSFLCTIAQTSPSIFLTRPLTANAIPFQSPEYAISILKITTYGTQEPIRVHCFFLRNDDSHDNIVDNDGEVLSVACETALPSVRFENDWDALVYDTGESDVKQLLLDFMSVSVTFGDYQVCSDTIGCNRVLLLYGPPGTGKTTICHGLSQKLSIRYSHRYQSAMILEVNTHSLFSKWFAESGKMVKKLFDKLNALASNSSALVFVLIDEVESLATARSAAASGSDPSDAIRVVNALLTQIDSIRRHKNVVIMATSNLTECIDVAFLSRADIRQFVGPPSERARYAILKSCIDELVDKGLVQPGYDLLDIEDCGKFDATMIATFKSTVVLRQAAQASGGFSGRILRRLPFLAFVFGRLQGPTSLDQFLQALLLAIKRQNEQDEKD